VDVDFIGERTDSYAGFVVTFVAASILRIVAASIVQETIVPSEIGPEYGPRGVLVAMSVRSRTVFVWIVTVEHSAISYFMTLQTWGIAGVGRMYEVAAYKLAIFSTVTIAVRILARVFLLEVSFHRERRHQPGRSVGVDILRCRDFEEIRTSYSSVLGFLLGRLRRFGYVPAEANLRILHAEQANLRRERAGDEAAEQSAKKAIARIRQTPSITAAPAATTTAVIIVIITVITGLFFLFLVLDVVVLQPEIEVYAAVA
jgi:hypothetical protein